MSCISDHVGTKWHTLWYHKLILLQQHPCNNFLWQNYKTLELSWILFKTSTYRNLSWPAVSLLKLLIYNTPFHESKPYQIWSFTFLPPTSIILDPNSTPIVCVDSFLTVISIKFSSMKNNTPFDIHLLSMNLCNKQLFPTAVSPITMNLNK